MKRYWLIEFQMPSGASLWVAPPKDSCLTLCDKSESAWKFVTKVGAETWLKSFLELNPDIREKMQENFFIRPAGFM